MEAIRQGREVVCGAKARLSTRQKMNMERRWNLC